MLDVKLSSIPPVSIVFTPIVGRIVAIVDNTLHDFNLHAIITSGCEGTHIGRSGPGGSQHYYNRAVDFRISDWPGGRKQEIFGKILKALGPSFLAILETDHLHVELNEGK